MCGCGGKPWGLEIAAQRGFFIYGGWGGFVACVFLCWGNTQKEAEAVGVGAHQRGELAM